MKRFVVLLSMVLLASAVLFGCGKKEEEITPLQTAPAPAETPQVAMLGPAQVNIPDEIRKGWTAIRIEVTNLETGKKEILAIDIGREKEIAGSGLRVKAVSFLPAFQMMETTVTSRSNELENPAAQIEVHEGEKQLFKGWLFTLYPTTHAFTHPRYSITLVEGVAAKKG